MTSENYRAVLDTAMNRYGELLRSREDIDVQINKLAQFIFATVNMLSDEDRETFLKQIATTSANFDIKSEGLSDAIRDILYDAPRTWFTVADMRDKLKENGFDFSSYSTNPLASVSTTLRRLVPKDAEVSNADAVTAYRFRNNKAARQRVETRRQMALYQNIFGKDALLGGLYGLGATTEPEKPAITFQPDSEGPSG